MTSQTESESTPRVGPVGLYLHTLGGKPGTVGEFVIKEQGLVIGTDDDYVLVQYFSWLDGRPTVVAGMVREQFYGPWVNLYVDRDEWIRAGTGAP